MSSIVFFPSRYPDEDFRSIVYRYHIWKGHVELESTIQELFKVSSLRNTYIPRNLAQFLERFLLGPEMSVEQILNEHTLWPLARPFLSEEQIEQCLKEINYGVTVAKNYASRIFSFTENRIITPLIRYCSRCLIEDYEMYGECYVHRLHQIDPVDICHRHHIRLITHCPICNVELVKKSGDRLLVAPSCPAGHSFSYFLSSPGDVELKFKLQLFKDCQIFMKASNLINRAELQNRFKIALTIKGYTHLSGTIKKKAFLADFEKAMSDMHLYEFGLTLQVVNTKRMFLEDWGFDLLLNIFIMRFLSGSVEEFLFRPMSFSVPLPFGPGPWNCINPICPEYDRTMIKNCIRKLKKNGTRISGSFCCPACGCSYLRRISPFEPLEKVRKPKIQEWGDLWESTLMGFYNQGLSPFQIAMKMKTDKGTIKRALLKKMLLGEIRPKPVHSLDNEQIALNELALSSNEVAAAASTSAYEGRLQACRQKVLDVVSRDQELTRCNIRQRLPGVYIWLMSHDREWMEDVLPKSNVGRLRQDWEAIDQELKEKVKEAAEHLYLKNPSSRIGRYTILNNLSKLDRGRMNFNKDKLSNAWRVLEKYEESQEDYQIRHLPNLVKQLQESGYKNITLNTIMSIRPSYRGCSDLVKSKLIEGLRGMGYKDIGR